MPACSSERVFFLSGHLLFYYIIKQSTSLAVAYANPIVLAIKCLLIHATKAEVSLLSTLRGKPM